MEGFAAVQDFVRTPHPPFLCFLFPESNNFSFANNGYSEDLEISENVAYIMACHADPSIPGTIDEWLDQFEMFSIYQVLPQILELWGENLLTQVDFDKF